MFPDAHPYAGGGNHYASYLVNADGYEVELVATAPEDSADDPVDVAPAPRLPGTHPRRAVP